MEIPNRDSHNHHKLLVFCLIPEIVLTARKNPHNWLDDKSLETIQAFFILVVYSSKFYFCLLEFVFHKVFDLVVLILLLSTTFVLTSNLEEQLLKIKHFISLSARHEDIRAHRTDNSYSNLNFLEVSLHLKIWEIIRVSVGPEEHRCQHRNMHYENTEDVYVSYPFLPIQHKVCLL